MELQKKKLSELKLADYNPRTHDKEFLDNLEKSIDEFGYIEPIIWNKRTGNIVGGHARFKILQKKGIEEAEVVVIDIPIEKEKVLNLALNKIVGEFDEKLLINLLSEIKGFDDIDIDLTGFSDIEINKMFPDEQIQENIELPKEAKYKIELGDIYRLGEHRVMCGDCAIKENVDKLMNGQKANMILTDPPYGMDLDTDFSDMKGIGKGKKYDKIIGDKNNFNPSFFIELFDYCKEQFWWGADYYAENIKNRLNGSWFVWDKTESGIRTNSAYEKQFGSNFELCWSKQKHKRQIVPVLWKGIFGLSKQDSKKRIHPTQKPLELCKWFIEKFSKQGQNIIDLFGGSGSTLIACEQTNRKCFMMEIDPYYCSVIIERWENFTNKKAEKVN